MGLVGARHEQVFARGQRYCVMMCFRRVLEEGQDGALGIGVGGDLLNAKAAYNAWLMASDVWSVILGILPIRRALSRRA